MGKAWKTRDEISIIHFFFFFFFFFEKKDCNFIKEKKDLLKENFNAVSENFNISTYKVYEEKENNLLLSAYIFK